VINGYKTIFLVQNRIKELEQRPKIFGRYINFYITLFFKILVNCKAKTVEIIDGFCDAKHYFVR